MITSSNSQSSTLLRQQRVARGWTLEQLADELYKLCRDEPRRTRGDINAQMISRWEIGKHSPSLYYQKKLCEIFGRSAEELGFTKSERKTNLAQIAEPDRRQFSLHELRLMLIFMIVHLASKLLKKLSSMLSG